MTIKTGFIHGTGADQNVSIGFIPDHVKIINITDGDKITGATSLAYGNVRQVILDSGSWAGGDAAGWFVFEPDGITGTFQSEAGYLNGGSTDYATIAAQDNDGIDIDTEVAGTTTDDTTITHYAGSTTAARGFKIGATVSENGKLLGYIAIRNDDHGPDVDQTTVW